MMIVQPVASSAIALQRGASGPLMPPIPAMRAAPATRALSRSNKRLYLLACRAEQENGSATTTQTAVAEPAAAAPAADGEVAPLDLTTISDGLTYETPSSSAQFWTKFKLAFALPWRRFSSESVLAFKIEGQIADQLQSRFSGGTSLPQICGALRKAALDPRVAGICVEIAPLQIGWAKVQEIRRHVEYFRKSGKFTIVTMKQGGEKEYYLASAFEEIYVPPTAYVSLRGFAVTGSFLRGVLDKVGVEPEIKRIGDYKSAGDQLLRRDMSEAQREQLGALLDDIHDEWVATVAAARGKTVEEVKALLDEGIYDMQKLKEGGWVTDLKYEDEIIEDLKARTGGKPDQVRKVGLRKYASVSPSAFGLSGKKRVALLRTSGAIVGASASGGGSISADGLIPKLRALAKDKGVAAVVLRVDSPGGDALASDLMWREIKALDAKKPVIASMGDVAASGGYYLSMAARKVVAQPLTVTGSIGIVTGKFNLREAYERIGFVKTVLSRGRYAESLSDNRSFTEAERDLFDRNAQFAYESFRNKAAESRNMPVEEMQAVAQGRVWTGRQALQRGLVDSLGGVAHAIEIAKAAAGIPKDERITVQEVSRASFSPASLLPGGASLAVALAALARGETPAAALAAAVGTAAVEAGAIAGGSGGIADAAAQLAALFSQGMQRPGQVAYALDPFELSAVSSLAAPAGGAAAGGSSSGDDSFLDADGSAPDLRERIENLLDVVL